MPLAGNIYSNLRRSTQSYDEELAIPQAMLDHYNSLPVLTRKPSAETEEAIYVNYERSYAAAAGQRWRDQQKFMGKENEKQRLVNILHAHDVMGKLQAIGVDARIETQSYTVWEPDDKTGRLTMTKRDLSDGRLWLHSVAVRGRVGVSAWVWDKHTLERKRKQITTLQYPVGPEWSLLYFDEFDVPIRERYRGWRTALMMLILNNVLTEQEVDKAFGPVTLGPVSELYRKAIHNHRERRFLE
jgi:hypothetical protein